MISAEDAVDPIVRYAREIYDISLKQNIDPSIKYDGFVRPPSILHICEKDPNRSLLDAIEEGGISPLQTLIMLAFQLGYEQGKRSDKDLSNISNQIDLLLGKLGIDIDA